MEIPLVIIVCLPVKNERALDLKWKDLHIYRGFFCRRFFYFISLFSKTPVWYLSFSVLLYYLIYLFAFIFIISFVLFSFGFVCSKI